MKRIGLPIIAALLFLSACNKDQDKSDAYGNFETVSIMVAAESQGKILTLSAEEGQKLGLNEVVGAIDSIHIHLKKKQLYAAIQTVNTKIRTLDAQIEVQKVQMKNMEREYKRITNLVNDGAATTKQKDDLEGNMELLNSQIKVLATQKSTIAAERNSFHVQIEQVNEQIKRSLIRNPINGVVLQKYKQAGEIVAPGQTIYKIANIDKLILRAYISGEQLSQVKIGQIVTVRIDGEEDIEEHEGKVTWVSSQAEFTPKIIQTREERVNLVYAFKVEVINDGRLKIGMPGEIKF
jgi:HlyD family secretion protein